MSLMHEYIKKKWDNKKFEDELIKLIKKYNKLRETYLLVYASAIEKPILQKSLIRDDYDIIHDMLRKVTNQNKLAVYLETPGGSAEVAEDIVNFFHSKFDTVSFIVSGQAMSAGTIMVLSGDEILMTQTGSLGPIDAQVKIGRSIGSSADYVDWVDTKRKQAKKHGKLNPFDATMIAQITPSEIAGVEHGLRYAHDLVIKWLPMYKFRSWNKTESTQKPVTQEMKEKRAKEIASALTNRTRWRTHGRSIKIDDLADLLKITAIDDDPELADTVYRIQIVCKFLFDITNTFKIFATADSKLFRQASGPGPKAIRVVPGVKPSVQVVRLEVPCEKCKTVHRFYGKFDADPQIDIQMKAQGSLPLPPGNEFACKCGAIVDLVQPKEQIQKKAGKPLVY